MNSDRIQELRNYYGPTQHIDERSGAIVELADTVDNLRSIAKGYTTPLFDPATAKPIEACLLQLMQCTADGDLISKSDRTWLVDAGLATRGHGFNMITPAGVMYLLDLGLIHP
ncbi:hypothetical protein [Hymenobacter fodinae]|uniref:Uncharacterized protein n=1 Tax=Hymenobacter fodinae TaxID=2510796 RepID=A0A4Z0P5F4_9BACT|nr:hypothetical protein [Hymenobacter fodinae]TGE05607.1 hypothetical protein EU556_20105 [Hymenobacter fodinae]